MVVRNVFRLSLSTLLSIEIVHFLGASATLFAFPKKLLIGIPVSANDFSILL